jgi:hypothetical protein
MGSHPKGSMDKICNISKCSDSGDFHIDYAFGRTVRIVAGSEDWLDLDDFLKAMSPSGIYERELIQ